MNENASTVENAQITSTSAASLDPRARMRPASIHAAIGKPKHSAAITHVPAVPMGMSTYPQ